MAIQVKKPYKKPPMNPFKIKPPKPKIYLAKFPITNSNILKFARYKSHNMDCVINALEILGVVDQKCAGIIRTLFKEYGVKLEYIEDFFKTASPEYEWGHTAYQNFDSFKNKIETELTVNHVCFCVVDWKTGGTHAFLIAREEDGNFVLIDGQINTYCYLNESSCYSYFNDVSVFRTLDFAM